jgi:hypothetical protein
MTTRARKGRILVQTSSLAGAPLDVTNRKDGSIVVYDNASGKYIHIDPPKGGGFETYPSVNDFPEQGDEELLYIDEQEGTTYLWDENIQNYKPIMGIVVWDNILNKPNSIESYGILNAYTKTEIGNPYTDFLGLFEAALLL